MIKNITRYSLMILPFILGLLVYDLAIKLKISYNESLPKQLLCQKGIAYERIGDSGTVYLKTKKECIINASS